MRAIFLVLIVAIVALIAALMTGLIDINQTRPAVAPGVEAADGKLVTRPGQAPAFDVQTGSVGVNANGSVAVPKIELKPSETRVGVPTIEVRRPGAAQPAPAPATPRAAPQANQAQ